MGNAAAETPRADRKRSGTLLKKTKLSKHVPTWPRIEQGSPTDSHLDNTNVMGVRHAPPGLWYAHVGRRAPSAPLPKHRSDQVHFCACLRVSAKPHSAAKPPIPHLTTREPVLWALRISVRNRKKTQSDSSEKAQNDDLAPSRTGFSH
jgi:hypothetical protein